MKICQSCGSYFDGKTWHDPKEANAPKGRELERAICPPCQMQKEGSFGGVLHMAGPILRDRREDVMSFLRLEESHRRDSNPLSRIVRVEENGDRWTVMTTSPHLAVHLGRHLKRKFGGRLRLHPDVTGHRNRREETNEAMSVNWESPAEPS